MSISRELNNENMIDLGRIEKSISSENNSSTPNAGVHSQIVKDYELMTISKKRIVSEAFPNQLDFDFSQKREIITCGQSALLSNGLVFAYRKKKVIEAVFIVEKNPASYDCQCKFVSSNVSEESVAEMEKDIRRQISLLVYYANFHRGTYFDQDVPMIEKEKRTNAWGIALLIGFAFAVCFYPAVKNIGFSIGLGIGQTILWFCMLNNRLVYNDKFTPSDKDQV